jgi:hypothetical protein
MPNYIPTLDLIAGFKAALESLQIPPGLPAGAGTGPLFQKVDYYDSENLADALKNLLILKQRVCFIVPAGDRYENSQHGGVFLHSKRLAEVDLLIADSAWTKAGQDAVFGGEKNLGILRMKDLVVEALTGSSLGLPNVALSPADGNFITVADDKAKDRPGRECWVQPFETWAGEARISLL